MGLAQTQRALAHLCTSESARALLRTDATAFGSEFSLTRNEIDNLAALGDTRLHAYADSLDRKRASEAARLLPVSARARGAAFRSAFLRYAREVPLGRGTARHVRDALAFARRLRRDASAPAVVRELLDFEAMHLRAGTAPGYLTLRTFAYPVAEVARAVAAGERWQDAEPRRTAVIWVALAGRVLTLVRDAPAVGRPRPVV